MDLYGLILKYFDRTITTDERRSLFTALYENKALSAEFGRLRNAIAVAASQPDEGDEARGQAALRRFKTRLRVRETVRRAGRILGYAAVLALVFGAWFLSKHETRKSLLTDNCTDIASPPGQRVSINLADGSEVSLSPSTRLRVHNFYEGGEREVELFGEAFFNVERDMKRPFIVKTEGYNVQVLGTEFNVCAYPGSGIFEADLVSGSLYVYDRGRVDSGLKLSPGEKAVESAGRLVREESDFQQGELSSNGIWQFSNVKLKAITKRMELWYGVSISLADPAPGEQNYSGKLRQGDNVEDILNAMKSVGKFDWRRTRDGGIEIFSP